MNSEYQEVRPHITDPDLMPVKSETFNEPPERGLFTSIYENKVILLIIVIVIVIILIIAYLIYRKPEPGVPIPVAVMQTPPQSSTPSQPAARSTPPVERPRTEPPKTKPSREALMNIIKASSEIRDASVKPVASEVQTDVDAYQKEIEDAETAPATPLPATVAETPAPATEDDLVEAFLEDDTQNE